MRSPQTFSRVNRNNGTVRKLLAAAALATASMTASAQAGDVNWDNGSTNFIWDTSSLNWTGAAWNNAASNGAIFGATGVGAINVNGPINVDSLDFTANGYSLNGAGPLNFVFGTSTATSGVVQVGTGNTAQLGVAINSPTGFQKIGAGTLVLSGSGNNFTAGVPLDGRSTLVTDVLIGGAFGTIDGGFLKLASASAMPANTRVSIGTGYLDIGSNNVTVKELIFTNQLFFAPWNTTLNANNGVIGSGTLRVTGDINVQGVFGDNSSNSIASNVDLGGGTQVIRISGGSSFSLNRGLIFGGSLSNGSLLKTIGYTTNGAQTTHDGISLFGNNTYTGATTLNAGNNVIAGTNATSSLKISGTGGNAGSLVMLLGANGSLQSATLIQAFATGNFILDNNAAVGDAEFIGGPPTPAAQNNNRIRDDATVELRDGSFTYRGRSAVAATETYGSLNVTGGHNIVTITPNGTGGTAALTAAGNLNMSSRSTLQVAGTTLGAAGKVFFNGTVPTADATGILPRIVGTNDFVTYNGATGVTPFTGYATDFSTAGTNVAITSATTVASSVNINALKRTGSFTLTINPGQTLGITSGMILNTSGTGVVTGGTIAFGPKPGVLFGSQTINSAVTGTDGLILASGTNTLAGDLSGLTGALDIYSGTANINTNTFTGAIRHRNGTLNLNVSQTGAGLGAITLGVAQNDANLVGLIPSISLSGAPAGATFDRDIVVDNGATTAAGVLLRYNQLPSISPLSNTTGSQTINGNFTLNTSVRLTGGGAGGVGATNIAGNVSGPATFYVPNGRVNFSGTNSNAGGFFLGDQGFTVKAAFLGTGTGAGPLTISGGNTNTVSYMGGALQSGTIRVWNSSVATAPQIIPLNNSTINNTIFLDDSVGSGGGDVIANVGAGITATWAGQLTGGGNSSLTKIGTGQLILGNANNTLTSPVVVSAGRLTVNGALPSEFINVDNGGTLGGTGAISGPVDVDTAGAIAPGNSVGTLAIGGLVNAGTFFAEIDMNNGGSKSADLLNVTGTVALNSATLDLTLLNNSLAGTGVFLLINNDGIDGVSGTFTTINPLPVGYTATINYAFNGVDSLGRVGNGNDVAITVVPEPTSIAAIGLIGVALAARRRRRR